MRVLNDRTAPEAWPQCVVCHKPYAFRRRQAVPAPVWCWSADCHHTAPPVITTVDGPARLSDEPWSRVAMSNGMRLECHNCNWTVVLDFDEDDDDAASIAHGAADRLAVEHDRCHEQARR